MNSALNAEQLRRAYIDFFVQKQSKYFKSDSLVPDDPTLLLTSAGMVQFKSYFLGTKALDDKYIGAVSCQKCARTTDIDVIGQDGRHLSFFEMLGNFSFGKYFKTEMCAWALEFSVDVLGFDKGKLHFTIYNEDEETRTIWQNLGIAPDHITALGKEDNFWTAGPTGPCGPCSELYYDQGPEVGCGKSNCKPGCDCDRFLEYWNCVFTQYDQLEDGTLAPLPQKNIDTGMGFERTLAILQGVNSNFETDSLRPLMAQVEELSGAKYGKSEDSDISLRIVTDHARAVTFLLADGVIPSNEGRGYVERRLIRRAIRHFKKLSALNISNRQSVPTAIMSTLASFVIEAMFGVYPELKDNAEFITKTLTEEENRFLNTLETGEVYLAEHLQGLKKGDKLAGVDAFILHDRYGFPIDLTKEIAGEKGVKVDIAGFEAEMAVQRDRARAAAKDDAWGEAGDELTAEISQLPITEFIRDINYYENKPNTAKVQLFLNESILVLDKTNFYAEKGGQVGDTGEIEIFDGSKSVGKFLVSNTSQIDDRILHNGKAKGAIKVGNTAVPHLNQPRRVAIERNHTATHLLQYALSQVLGNHIKQAGSLVSDTHLRFDFTHDAPLTPDQISQVENIVNTEIFNNQSTNTVETTVDEARKSGAVALFGEKYGDTVRMVSAGLNSVELCGGTHVSNTAQIGLFKISLQTSVAAGVRRIEAVTGEYALELLNSKQAQVDVTVRLLKTQADELIPAIERLQGEIKQLKQAQKSANKGQIEQAIAQLSGQSQLIDSKKGKYSLVAEQTGEFELDDMREMWTKLNKSKKAINAVVLLGTGMDGQVQILAAGDKTAVSAGFNAGEVIKSILPILNAKGGGGAPMAQATGGDAKQIDAALLAIKENFIK